MTDIYPQSPDDSHSPLAEQHPLAKRVKELEQELEQARETIITLAAAFKAQNPALVTFDVKVRY